MSAPVTPRRRHVSRNGARPWWQWGAMAVAGVLGFVVVYAQTVLGQIDGAFDARSVDSIVTNRPVKPTGGSGDALNILLMGSDVRDGENGDIGGVVPGMRSDTTIIMHISADRSRVELLSIPRDTQVDIADCTLFDGTPIEGSTADFNVAFSNGGRQGDPSEGAACTINTIESLTGIYIDHYAVIDFAGFANMIDALGGVPMCIPTAIDSKKARLHLEAGPQILDGKTALGFARLRTAESGGVSGSDLQRITRQQELLNQIAATALSKNLLTDVGDLTHFVRAGAEAMTMDPELADTSYLLGIAYSLSGIDRDAIVFATVPWEYTEDRNNVLLAAEAEQTWEQLRTDTPLTVVAEGDASSAWDNGHKDSGKDDGHKKAADASSPDEASAPLGTSNSANATTAATTSTLLDECA